LSEKNWQEKAGSGSNPSSPLQKDLGLNHAFIGIPANFLQNLARLPGWWGCEKTDLVAVVAHDAVIEDILSFVAKRRGY
jgi:hypothetical protein